MSSAPMDPALRIDFLRNWREAQGMTIKAIAALLNRSYAAVWKWENGGAMVPDWLPDWLEYVELQVGAGYGKPFCPPKAHQVRRILYAEEKQRQDAQAAASARWKAAGEARKQVEQERAERRSVRIQRRENAEKLAEARQDPNRYRPQLRRRSADEKMRDMAEQLNKLYPKK